jgi:YesN/AraC family two-component response regulator
LPYRILFVDDDETLLKGLECAFQQRATVEIAKHGLAGLASVNENGPFAVVVSDYKMPVMNGLEFFERVKEVSPCTIRILFSAYCDHDFVRDAVDAKLIHQFIRKPCNLRELVSTLESALEIYPWFVRMRANAGMI